MYTIFLRKLNPFRKLFAYHFHVTEHPASLSKRDAFLANQLHAIRIPRTVACGFKLLGGENTINAIDQQKVKDRMLSARLFHCSILGYKSAKIHEFSSFSD